MVRRAVSIAPIASLAAPTAQAGLLMNAQGMVTGDRSNGYSQAGTGVIIGPAAAAYVAWGSVGTAFENGCTVRVERDQAVKVLSPATACGPQNRAAAVLPYAGSVLAGPGVVAPAIALSRASATKTASS